MAPRRPIVAVVVTPADRIITAGAAGIRRFQSAAAARQAHPNSVFFVTDRVQSCAWARPVYPAVQPNGTICPSADCHKWQCLGTGIVTGAERAQWTYIAATLIRHARE